MTSIRPGGTGDEGKDPSGFADLMAGLAVLYTGHLDRQPSLRALSAVVGVGKSTIDNWLSDRTFSYQVAPVLAMVDAIALQVERRGLDGDPAIVRLLDHDSWKRAHRDELRGRTAAAGRAAEHERAFGRSDLQVWHQAPHRAAGSLPYGSGDGRVGDAQPIVLGVHRPIRTPETGDSVLPPYVDRDLDLDETDGLRARLKAAARSGGFILLAGAPSTGKSRSAYEAVTALLPEWRLVHPDSVTQLAELAPELESETVIWLDELQNYLEHDQERMVAVVRALLGQPRIVLLGTVWSELLSAWLPAPPQDEPDVHRSRRELLKVAEIIWMNDDLSDEERKRARALAESDERIKIAIEADGYGFAQTIAAVPQLVARWSGADAYSRALISAAVDAVTTLGLRRPLPAELLRSAAPAYCDSRARAQPPADWFERALEYTTTVLAGATSALIPEGPPDGGMGETSGYTVPDYLRHHVSRELGRAATPERLWEACIDFLYDPDELALVGLTAQHRLLYRYAETLYKKALTRGSDVAVPFLAKLLGNQGRLEDLRALAHEHDHPTIAVRLAEVLVDRNKAREAVLLMRPYVSPGNSDYFEWPPRQTPTMPIRELAKLLLDQGDLEEVGVIAAAGHSSAALGLAAALRERNETGRAIEVLRPLAGSQPGVVTALADLLVAEDEVEEAIELLRPWFAAYFTEPKKRLLDLLVSHGRIDEMRSLSNPQGSPDSPDRLARYLVDTNDEDELRALHANERRAAENGENPYPYFLYTKTLAQWLAGEDRAQEAMDVLRSMGDDYGLRSKLADLLLGEGEEAELRSLLSEGHYYSAGNLSKLLTRNGRETDALEVLLSLPKNRRGHYSVELADLLIRADRLEEAITIINDINPGWAPKGLAQLLVTNGMHAELRSFAERGHYPSFRALIDLLVEAGRTADAIDFLRPLVEQQKAGAAEEWAKLLIASGREPELRLLADLGHINIEIILPHLLESNGRPEAAARLRRYGLTCSGWLASE